MQGLGEAPQRQVEKHRQTAFSLEKRQMDDKLIELLLEDGLTLGQVSRLTGVSKSALFRLGKHKHHRVPHDPALKEQAKELSAKGHTSKEISAMLGVPASTIRTWV